MMAGQHLMAASKLLKEKIVFGFLLMLLCSSCRGKINNHDGKVIENSICIDYTEETGLNNLLKIRDKDQQKIIGDIGGYGVVFDSIMPHVYVYSSDKNEYVIAFQWYGDGRNTFSWFEVGYVKSLSKEQLAIDGFHSDIPSFHSNNGTRLGMKKGELIQLLGDCYTRIDSHHILVESKNDIYEAHYYFKEDRLISFQFGLVYQ